MLTLFQPNEPLTTKNPNGFKDFKDFRDFKDFKDHKDIKGFKGCKGCKGCKGLSNRSANVHFFRLSGGSKNHHIYAWSLHIHMTHTFCN